MIRGPIDGPVAPDTAVSLRILPKFVLFRADTGLLGTIWFGRLKASPRNCSVFFSATLNVRDTAISSWKIDGPCSVFRTDRKSTRLNSSHLVISYAVFCL